MKSTEKQKALILAPHTFNFEQAKTAFGLIRGTDRFEIVGVIDPEKSGQDAGVIVDGNLRGIPVFASSKHAVEQLSTSPEIAIVGITPSGGLLIPKLLNFIEEAIEAGLDIVNGLHEFLEEKPNLVEAARRRGVKLHDIRKPRSKMDLHFWSGEITRVRAPRIVVMGTDCAVGKRTTTRWLMEACNQAGIKTEMIFTGQTGWMQSGHEYGFLFDSTPNDFVSGELEDAIVRCDRECSPDLILLEGQSSLRNPSGPCGSEFLCSAMAKGVILQHVPGRKTLHFNNVSLPMPDIQDDLELIRIYGARTLALTLSSEGLDLAELEEIRIDHQQRLGLPVFLPKENGVEGLVAVIKDFLLNVKNAEGLKD